MNRKKRINQMLKAKQKKANAKLHNSNKPRYISKAERAKMEAEEQHEAPNEAQEAVSVDAENQQDA